jgi:hypothetical protein
VSIFTSLLTRVRSYVGPRDLPTGESYKDGYERQASPLATPQTRWFLSDLEVAIQSAAGGNLRMPGRLCSALRRDGMILGVSSTRFDGLVQLPVTFHGDRADDLAREFRAVFPTPELAMLASDGRMLGVGVGEFVQIAGSLPVLRRLNPEFLQYRWSEDRWYYQSIHGVEPVNPGDGRWVLHCPGGAVEPWTHGFWPALGRSFIAKDHAFFLRENYANKLANSARVASAPPGATELQREGFLRKVIDWAANPVFELPVGWGLNLLESNGRGYEVYQDIIKTSNEEIMVCIAGQTTTTDGGKAFASSAIFQTIRSDLIQADANALADTLNTQAIPVWANERFGADAAANSPRVAWDVTPSKDLNTEALAANQAAVAAKAFNDELKAVGKRVNVVEFTRRYGVPIEDIKEAA